MATRRTTLRLLPAPQRRRQRPAPVQLPAARVGAAGAGALGRRCLQIEDLEVKRLHVHELRVDQQSTTAGASSLAVALAPDLDRAAR
jgi:hypothetical protein